MAMGLWMNTYQYTFCVVVNIHSITVAILIYTESSPLILCGGLTHSNLQIPNPQHLQPRLQGIQSRRMLRRHIGVQLVQGFGQWGAFHEISQHGDANDGKVEEIGGIPRDTRQISTFFCEMGWEMVHFWNDVVWIFLATAVKTWKWHDPSMVRLLKHSNASGYLASGVATWISIGCKASKREPVSCTFTPSKKHLSLGRGYCLP